MRPSAHASGGAHLFNAKKQNGTSSPTVTALDPAENPLGWDTATPIPNIDKYYPVSGDPRLVPAAGQGAYRGSVTKAQNTRSVLVEY